MIGWVPLLVMLVGLVLYVVATQPKVAELGRIAFAFGLLVTLFKLAGEAVRIL